MSNLTGLPPSAITRAGMQANTQDLLVRIVQLPSSLQNNSTPQKIIGTILGQNTDGTVKLQTDQGVISMMMKDRGSLPAGLKVEIEIPAGRNPTQASIRQADNTQITTTTTQAPHTQNAVTNSNPALLNAALSAGVKLDRTNNVSAKDMQDLLTTAKNESALTAVKPAMINIGETIRLNALPTAGTAQNTVLNTEAEIIQTLLNLIAQDPESVSAQKLLNTLKQLPLFNTPQSNTPPQAPIQNLQNQLTALQTKMDMPPQSAQTTTPSDTLPRTFEAKIIAILPSLTQTPSAIPQSLTPQQNSQITLAQFVNTEPKTNLPLFQITTPHGTTQNFTLPFPVTNLNQGQSIIIQPLLITAENDINLSPQNLINFIKSGTWDSLQDIIHHLNALSPMGANPLINQLPSTQNTAQNNPLALIFLSMLKGGEIDQWIPSQMLSLLRDNNKANIIRALQTDQAILGRIDSIPLANDWKLNLFPLWHEHIVHKFPLYSKSWEEEDKNDPEKRRKKMRFLFDLNLSRMGKIQVDGFFQSEDKTPRLDMIVRAEHALSPSMQQNMKQQYTKSLERSALNGELSFQFRPDQWVNTDDMLFVG